MDLKGQIRMIRWGVIPTEKYFSISVDQMVAGRENYKVVEIVEELTETGRYEWHIVCVRMKDEKQLDGIGFVWKTYYKTPDEIQYFGPSDQHDYLLVK
jgi:hypothetical protein